MRASRTWRPASLLLLASVASCERGGLEQPPPPPPPVTHSHYVSTQGSAAGDGSALQPWDLPTALKGAGGKILPGDTVWLRGGTYTPGVPLRSTVSGAAGSPVVIRQYAGEHVVLDAVGFSTDTVRRDFFTVRGDYTVLWGLEFTDSDPGRTSATRANLLVNDASHTRYINLIIHDGGIGVFNYAERTDVEVTGCIIFDNGWAIGPRGDGHALYVQSNAGPLVLRDNVLFDQFGYGVHAYSDHSDALLNNITLDGNVSFNNGLQSGSPSGANILVGGIEPADGIVARANMTYFSPGINYPNVRLGWSKSPAMNGTLTFGGNYIVGGAIVFEVHTWQRATVTGNTLAVAGGGEVVRLNDSSTVSTTGYTWEGNSYYTAPTDVAWSYHDTAYTFPAWQAKTGLGTTDQVFAAPPSVSAVFVRPNAYEAGRAHVVVYNWGNQASVPVTPTGILQPGDHYDVWSVQALFGPPLVSGTYDGGSIDLPMSQRTPPVPIGLASSAAPPTLPAFDVFLLIGKP